MVSRTRNLAAGHDAAGTDRSLRFGGDAVVMTAQDSPLLRMTQETPTQYWNDSCAVDELAYAVERGATGATSNPSIAAVQEATFRGVNINATVSFTVPQALAAAEAVERGLARREAAGLDVASMTPIVTIMVGRLDDWMKVLVERDDLAVHPDATSWGSSWAAT